MNTSLFPDFTMSVTHKVKKKKHKKNTKKTKQNRKAKWSSNGKGFYCQFPSWFRLLVRKRKKCMRRLIPFSYPCDRNSAPASGIVFFGWVQSLD